MYLIDDIDAPDFLVMPSDDRFHCILHRGEVALSDGTIMVLVILVVRHAGNWSARHVHHQQILSQDWHDEQDAHEQEGHPRRYPIGYLQKPFGIRELGQETRDAIIDVPAVPSSASPSTSLICPSC
jgi:hypothetical protein